MVGIILTPEQSTIVEHECSAFISACPGAGKTRCIVERARKVLTESKSYRGLAFLSFTNAAISELQNRLTKYHLLPIPNFPHFVGTFDSFIWHYIVAPFGLDGCDNSLRIIPDTGSLIITPFPGAQGLRFDCFERSSGNIIPEEARKAGFNRNPSQYEIAAQRLRSRLLARGQLDFDDVRLVARTNLEDDVFSNQLGQVLRARFGEIIVDEAQDCNPEDLLIISWLRDVAKIPTKVVCDPNQSIYGFRGGVSDELFNYASTFPEEERLPLTGNFRSSSHICKAIHMLRAPSQRGKEDDALGDLKDCNLSVHILSYGGQGVSSKIGAAFAELVISSGIDMNDCRLTAKTRSSGLKAIGAYADIVGDSLSLRLAVAVMKYHYAESSKEHLSAVIETHRIMMAISGKLDGKTYHQALSEEGLETLNWRGQVFKILQSIRFNPEAGDNREEWVARAQNEFHAFLPPDSGTIAQKLRNQKKLDDILGVVPVSDLNARTIHEVKGKQYQGICVVLTTAKANGILTHLENEPDDSNAEDVRELYVAASRAEKLLAIACPKVQSKRLEDHISQSGAAVQISEI